MIRNFIVTAFRKFSRNKYHSIINIIGLTLGISCAFIIFKLVRFELSYEKHHEGWEDIYRVVTISTEYGKEYYRSGVPYKLAESFPIDFEQVPDATIINFNFRDPLIYVEEGGEEKIFEEPRLVYVEPAYFRIFTYEWIYGSKENAFENPNSVVVSESVALKYFGTTDVVGRTVNINREEDLSITAVVNDPPNTTDLSFNMFVSYDLIRDNFSRSNWLNVSDAVQYYVKIPDKQQFEYVNSELTAFFNSHWDNTENVDVQKELWLEPLSDVHFDTKYGWNFGRAVSENTLWGLSLIGLFLIITASINFINLNTALVSTRIMEVGVRKVMGSSRLQLSLSFLLETALITAIALVISLGLAELALFTIEPILGYPLDHKWLSVDILVFVLILFVVTVVLSGLFPSYLISKFKPVEAMKYRFISDDRSLGSRRLLIIFQFFISQTLIICTAIVVSQLSYFKTRDMGFSKDHIMEFFMPQTMEKHDAFKAELAGISGIDQISYSNTGAASTNLWWGGFEYNSGDQIIEERSDVKYADEDFIETYGLQLLAGNDIAPRDSAAGFVVNEAFLRIVGAGSPEELLGNNLKIYNHEAPIIGVIKDYVASSLKREIKPLIIIYQKRSFHTCAVKYNPESYESVVAAITNSWKDIYPDNLFEFLTVEQKLDRFYSTEDRLAKLFYIFAVVAILIGCIGLLGLVSFMASKKRKEVGIRKVMGASVFQIIKIFAREFAILIIAGFVIASIVSYYSMQQWLEAFPFRISLGAIYFILGIALTMTIAILTVGWQSFRAANVNPATILRDE